MTHRNMCVKYIDTKRIITNSRTTATVAILFPAFGFPAIIGQLRCWFSGALFRFCAK